ncbi:hypothetical protein [Kaistia soli]|uniref:hypothetical protein n=1 Tax=Kaistia soli TaxID=446684 RepID=UPI001114FE0F|nr:hypothetical protein [Kaistia soli]
MPLPPLDSRLDESASGRRSAVTAEDQSDAWTDRTRATEWAPRLQHGVSAVFGTGLRLVPERQGRRPQI